MRLSRRKILLGVTGCIAAYKAAWLVRLLKKEGAEVHVVMTASAEKFITRLTMETLSDYPVSSQVFPETGFYATHHISMAEWADLIVVAPATGNMIGKIASGIADDLLSTVVMAAQSPVIIAPAMNTQMYTSTVVQENIKKLRALGFEIIDPAVGEMACNTFGPGRLPEPEQILEHIVNHFEKAADLAGLNVLVSAGPTVEHIDPVRIISNPSSGKMGYAIAERAALRGAHVILVSGPVSLAPPPKVDLVQVKTGSEMFDRLKEHFGKADILFMVAAVSDYVPKETSEHKIKKTGKDLNLTLKPQVDILMELSRQKDKQIMVGFSMETENDVENAARKLESKKLDMIVLNNLKEPGSGFGSDTNKATIIDRSGQRESLPLMSKIELADKIIDYTLKFVK